MHITCKGYLSILVNLWSPVSTSENLYIYKNWINGNYQSEVNVILTHNFKEVFLSHAWYYEITKPTHSRFKSYFIKNLFAFKDYPETITITLEKCYCELRCLCKWITKILKIIRVPHEDAESPIVDTLFARLPVRPSKLVCNHFRFDTITQTVFIVQLSNFVQ